MRFKKLLVLFLMFVFTLNSSSLAFALESEKDVIKSNGYTITVSAKTNGYTKLEIIHDDTQKLEVLEAIKQGNDWEYISTADGNKTYMKRQGDRFLLFNQNYELIRDIDIADNSISRHKLEGIIEPKSDWGPKHYFQGNTGTLVTVLSTVIAIIATIAQVPTNDSVIITIATAIVSLALPVAYYSGYYQTMWEDALYYTQRYTTFYRFSNYSGQLGSTVYSFDFH